MEGDQNPASDIGGQGQQDFTSLLGGGQSPTNNGQAVQQTAPKVPTKPLEQAQGEGVEPEGQQTQETTPAAAPATSQAPAVQQQPSHADIIRETANAVLAAQQSKAQVNQTPKSLQDKSVDELSPEEFAQRFQVARAQPALVEAILSGDPTKSVAALDTYGQNLVRQAVTMALEIANAHVAQVRNEFSPHIQSWQTYQQTQREQKLRQEFFTEHPDLVGEEALVDEVKDAMLARLQAGQIKPFASTQDAKQAVAETVRRLLKRTGTNGTAPANGAAAAGQQAQSTGRQTSSRQMSAASSAGRSGTGQAAAKSDVEAIFGADAR